jgi:hypothetical protein
MHQSIFLPHLTLFIEIRAMNIWRYKTLSMSLSMRLNMGLFAGVAMVAAMYQPANAGSAINYESAPFEIKYVDSRSNVFPVGQPKVLTSPLEVGKNYKIEVSGLWTPDYAYSGYTLDQLNENPGLLASSSWLVDARYVTIDSWSTYQDDDPRRYADFGLYSSLVGADADEIWGTYNGGHQYASELVGTGSAADFYVEDINYSDNFGVYTVSLYREATPDSVPGPAPWLAIVSAISMSRAIRRKYSKALGPRSC